VYRFRLLWIRLKSSLWFVPGAMVALAIALAVGLTLIDLKFGVGWTSHYNILFGVGAAGARGMLSAIAGSMMTVASLTFSLTISTLAAASAQYSSRLIRNFMRDRVNQFVLGYFVGLFAYCLVVLRTIRGGDEGQFVPPLAVLGGLILALLSIAVLIYFIHHIAESIQVGTILQRVTEETIHAIEELFPTNLAEPAEPDDVSPDEVRERHGVTIHTVLAGAFGYVQTLDAEPLLALSTEKNGVVRVLADVGAFVTPGGAICAVSMQEEPDDELLNRLRAAFHIGAARTIEQDAAFGIRQIVDIALRALSPGVNDTTTGVMCVEHIGVLLETIAGRPIPNRRRAQDGVVRIITPDRSFAAFASLSLDQIRRSASGNAAVHDALLRAVAIAARRAAAPDRRLILTRHAALVAQSARESITCLPDLAPILAFAERTMAEISPHG